ncbi:hypothetical protein ACGFYU_34110 [Streptomyces sp. NPDC048337]|uniref:hypothetical protein n=1 Tax=Streptomyces sp. NPDC048337 TaxID=3365535 RepID=UPI0037147CE1
MRTVWALGAVAVGALLCVAGWYGVSGERFAERQIPYLASCTVPGAALIVAGAQLLGGAGRRPERADGPPGSSTDAASSDTSAAAPSSSEPPVRVPGGTLAHRPDCPLVDGRPEVLPATGEDGLTPCPVCEPPWPR